MIIDSINTELHNGNTFQIVSLREEDGAALLFHMKETAGETYFLSSYAEEIGMDEQDVRRQKQFLKGVSEDPRMLFIGALLEGELVGVASILPESSRQKAKHRGGICVSVRKKFWRQGIGRALLEALLHNAAQLGYTQLELSVLEDNAVAYKLYREYEFQVYGTLPNAFKLKDGTDKTAILMYREL